MDQETDSILCAIVLWVDSAGVDTFWIDKDAYKPRVAHCISVGIVAHQADDHVTITSSMNYARDGQYAAPITIPRKSIISLTTFKVRSTTEKSTDSDRALERVVGEIEIAASNLDQLLKVQNPSEEVS